MDIPCPVVEVARCQAALFGHDGTLAYMSGWCDTEALAIADAEGARIVAKEARVTALLSAIEAAKSELATLVPVSTDPVAEDSAATEGEGAAE
jgi:hypothetical protein